jgi:hypothetical protein
MTLCGVNLVEKQVAIAIAKNAGAQWACSFVNLRQGCDGGDEKRR